MNQPLEGIKVLDFSRVLAGPYCTMMLSDMGAEVIKIERPELGDDTRHFGPFQNGESGYFMFLNRGKKSIEMNLKDSDDRESLMELIKDADVIVENFRPGVMENLGLGYETLKEVNEGLIYCSISGFGQYGPLKKRPAYDLVAQAMGGIASITGHPDNPPTRSGASLGDMSAALYAAYGIMVALFHRERTGIGQAIDVAMVDTIFSLLEHNVMRYTSEGVIPERIGSRHPISAPFDVFETKEGSIVIATANEPLFVKLCSVMGKEELLEDERFKTDILRGKNEAELKVILEEWLSGYTADEAVDLISQAGVPCSTILNIAEISESDHIKEREMLLDVEHPVAGKTRIPGNPVKLSATPVQIKSPSPALGEHNNMIKKTTEK
ncbi:MULTISPECIES: CaiB/BaiF CoA-transferase family protein [unclassified Sporosarcina]|uniref:CaiB/BaiF CoA transferase family protein n=1 Tax=unclassified Sporosarcina TaxID=2647733 RepID=UPI00203EB5FC|nr:MULTISPECIES: CoA transferase [unclassified Sporosarcina]GKV66213.1 CoA transferase [Sporosarcina sp. NCCP-2331]GLB56179.1 CoA transferase [Sporosarcina sp. NCCP-2378]